MYKKCQVVMLPTIQKAIFILNVNSGEIGLSYPEFKPSEVWTYANLHILSDDEVEISDWVIVKLIFRTRILQCQNELLKSNCKISPNRFKKVIASTDPSLNLPSPSKKFLQIYCEKQPTEVLVKYEAVPNEWDNPFTNPEGIETSDSKCEVYTSDNNQISQISIKKVKQTYTREEVQPLVDALTKAQELLNESADAGYYPQSALQINGGQGFGFITEILKSFNK